MKLFLLSSILSFLIIACQVENDTNEAGKFLSQPIVTGKTFFDYDTICHYFNDINEYQSPELFDNYEASVDDSIRTNLIIGNTPTGINDLSFIGKLETFGYRKRILAPSLYKTIDSVFIEQTDAHSAVSACIYVYRDILIFKKKSKVVGIAKICFACGNAQIHGTTAITKTFGQNGGYELLEKALRK